ncbi:MULTISPECIES: primase-helicase family protein [Bradyrhizobium]|uniref:primase-helicase family protein n=1 Tax=Bradyrhizobium TaxID=374 RepID=UPI001EDA38B4|nr:primase-helicase family protein [Bradyrhizobium zhengyangense]MCG2639421.1 DUF5906 domain-containing protein [Bradyrhizobium zhengyangense]
MHAKTDENKTNLAAQLRNSAVTDDQLRAITADPKTGYCGCGPADTVEVAKAVLAEREAAKSEPFKQAAVPAPPAPWVTASQPAAPTPVNPLAPVASPTAAQLAAGHKQVAFTFAMDSNKCGAKEYVVNPDGSVGKNAHGTSRGQLAMMMQPLDFTASLTNPQNYVMLGLPKGKNVGEVVEYGISGDASFTRSGAHIEYRKDVPGILVCDLDPRGSEDCFPALEYRGPAAYHADLINIFPALANADAVSHPSGSHGDLTEIATGKVHKRSEGTHCRFAIKDMSDMLRALKAFSERSVLLGHGHAFVDAAGTVHIRSPVDASLSAIARPVFSCPAMTPPGYELRNRPAPHHVYGEFLDTKTAIPDLTTAERTKHDTIVKDLKNRPDVKALSKQREAAFLKANPAWARSINSVGRSKEGYPTFMLRGAEMIDVVGVGTLTARELGRRYDELTDGGKRKLYCRDPLDPGYGNDSIAIVYKDRIFSWAHHGRIFQMPGTEPPHSVEDFDPETDKRLWDELDAIKGTKTDAGFAYAVTRKAFSYRHAAIRDGANLLLLDRRHLSQVDTSVGLLSTTAFSAIYNTYNVELPSFDDEGKEGEPFTVNLPLWWYKSEYRHVYDNLAFAPMGKRPGGKPVTSNAFNLWRGFSCEPCEQGSCEKFKAYLRDIICGGDRRGFEWVWRWLAHLVQRPWEKPGVALALTGEQGVGKTTLAEIVGALFNPKHFIAVDNMDRVTGQFTSHFALAIVVLLDEAFWTGDKARNGQVKSSITSPSAHYESKGKDGFTIDSYSRYIYASNDEHVINAELSDRRHTVFEVADHFGGNREKRDAYFGALRAEMYEQGGLARLFWELRQFDVGDGRFFPYENAARAKQQARTLEPVAQFVFDHLTGGTGFWTEEGAGMRLPTPELFEAFEKSGRDAARHIDVRSFGIRLPKVLDVHKVRFKHGSGGTMVRGYVFPTLIEARQSFVTKTRIAVNWETGEIVGTVPSWLRWSAGDAS